MCKAINNRTFNNIRTNAEHWGIILMNIQMNYFRVKETKS